jgi:hypothetical protein
MRESSPILKFVASITDRCRVNASKFGPAANYQTLVTNVGATSKPPASDCAITTVGSPIPITPLTNPASSKAIADTNKIE